MALNENCWCLFCIRISGTKLVPTKYSIILIGPLYHVYEGLQHPLGKIRHIRGHNWFILPIGKHACSRKSKTRCLASEKLFAEVTLFTLYKKKYFVNSFNFSIQGITTGLRKIECSWNPLFIAPSIIVTASNFGRWCYSCSSKSGLSGCFASVVLQ